MKFLAEEYQRGIINTPSPLLSGMDRMTHSLLGPLSKGGYGTVQEYLAEAGKIDSKSEYWHNLSSDELHKELMSLKEAFRRRKKGYEKRINDAIGAIREASVRTIGLRPYNVQLVGALALYNGFIAEMATGEGKTLTSVIAGVLHGWSGLPCHIVTVNDYLASRDAHWMSPLYGFCGVKVGKVTSEMGPGERIEGHHCDVTYTTSKEIMADFLRDRLWLGDLAKTNRRQIAWFLGRQKDIERGLVMRGIHTVIVDEADSILIDEAVTPLIISKSLPNDTFVDTCRIAYEIASKLRRDEDYKVDIKYKDIELAPKTSDRIALLVKKSDGVFKNTSGYIELVHQALIAREFFNRNEQYVIQDNEVVIVDEFTGRQMPQRKWRAGIHQCVEAKEKLPITSPTETLARLSFQRFFRFFKHLSGMTGTAREAAQEFWDIYDLAVLTIPENKACRRKLYPERIFPDRNSKLKAIVSEILRLHKKGQPVLVGTRSVKASEMLASRLDRAGLSYQLLNAKNHKSESSIVAQAGQRGAITIATNMAGRGTDIKLGEGVCELGGLHVIASECHESSRIDRQLFGRCSRQGDPGSAQLFVSMEDELVVRYVPQYVRKLTTWHLKKKLPGSFITGRKTIEWSQAAAGAIAYKKRRSVLNADTWLEDSLSFAKRDVL